MLDILFSYENWSAADTFLGIMLGLAWACIVVMLRRINALEESVVDLSNIVTALGDQLIATKDFTRRRLTETERIFVNRILDDMPKPETGA